LFYSLFSKEAQNLKKIILNFLRLDRK